MKYTVTQIGDKKIWEGFSLSVSPNTFLQSWSWGEFNESLGRKIWRLGVYDKSNLVGISLLLKHTTKLGSYLYCPRGPLLDWKNKEIFKSLFEELKKVAAKENCNFIKLDPLLENTPENREFFFKFGFKPAVTFVQVEDAWLLPLDKSEEEILSSMRKTTRYLIRHEPKQGINIEASTEPETAKKFVDLLYSTASRKGFANHPKEYYTKQFEILAKEGQQKIFIAKKGGKVLSMAMIVYYGEMGYYLHAASDPTTKQSVGYSLQWEALKEAKRRGCKYYNFWGVVKDKNFHPEHPWYGFSLFKKGFGGFKYNYIRAQDYPISAGYYLYRFAEKIRRLASRIRSGYWED
ncbi:peptidoglycan bridge formation glycyltransferase FemA/FemB family protein [Patescibacteria group bacterium]|nr:peptidoglycan bridge formation glycyltransferase FemA/FemB family protein [Patescibacteria group bacterium]